MRECVRHRMTVGQLARFASANGLRLDGSRLFAPDGENVGRVRLVRGAPLILLVFQESYSLPAQAGDDGCLVTAWWPAFRPAWTLVTGDGQVEIGDLLGPDEVICDLCNAEVTIRPVPLVQFRAVPETAKQSRAKRGIAVGGYALCAACFARQGMPFPGTIGPYCVLPARDCERVDDERRGV
jgi:hypothetical protein